MTATVPESPTAPPHPHDAPTVVLEPGADPAVDQRGRVDVADQVVEKIAIAALAETDGVGGTSGTVDRMLGRDEAGGRPRVSATVSGRSVRLDARISVAYPSPVAATCDRARAHVVRQVESLTGLGVARVDIAVSALTLPRASSTGRDLA
ncbi:MULTISPECIES: Asp23/Gls24 family envelope stress response protein [Pseudonocardia]|uniref:Alkaline shock protein 23 n=2 Tax=Pseudonocardia TaxID=1847 RepID=A0A1Y2MXI3_PSEAH|nr:MULTISPECIES: Asp23/Gls24 family envelope stress response protein [Pseudonocardia]OSY39916.1 hypothetical protein BG845_03151 [Pseudonocardia autotrophica]TDN74512.1 putative alkaline shock family protein YloU [Pseudonocardia autotrophica]BBG05280.1 hypothetical protein Pdca_64890 [Pseudonocardia autotrophica]GEC28850.1 hypothetical protein PSA01_58790 [Pseudonocardia saturnea]